MKVYKVEFEGYWPVGAYAIVVAKDRGQAKRLLNPELAKRKLPLVEDIDDFKPINTDVAHAEIISDGNY